MLSATENEALCHIGPKTLMGNVMRQYWIPALLSDELPGPGTGPIRLRLLGEDLIAFRDTAGQAAIFFHTCPHRGASLFFGRNEDEGIRCVYHGWKFDATGQCVDMPNEPSESNFKHKVRAWAYPTRERGGVVWTYMGPRKEPPPLPDIEPTMLPQGQANIWLAMRECNWAQALEGDVDTSHLGFLHMGAMRPEDAEPRSFNYYTVKDRAPRYRVLETDAGVMYGAYRPAEDDTYYWRTAQFMFPFFTLIPTGELGKQVLVRAWVPIDDEHTMYWSMGASGSVGSAAAAIQAANFSDATARVPLQYLPNTSGWLGRWRLAMNFDNDYGLDREEQRSRSYTGIEGIHLQDQAITESMGTIYNRGIEHLGTSDTMVIATRRRILRVARDLEENGVTPPGVDTPEVYRRRSGGVILPRDADWVEATEEARSRFMATGLEA